MKLEVLILVYSKQKRLSLKCSDFGKSEGMLWEIPAWEQWQQRLLWCSWMQWSSVCVSLWLLSFLLLSRCCLVWGIFDYVLCLEMNIACLYVSAFTQLLTLLKNLHASYVLSMRRPFVESCCSLSLPCCHPLVSLCNFNYEWYCSRSKRSSF